MVTWGQIKAECDGFRAGFVAVYRKYEGQPTDEKDGRGAAVKVTGNSFARHNGIAETTFKDWVKGTGAARLSTPGRARSDLKRAMEGMKPEDIIREIAKVAPDAVLDVAMEQSGRTRSKAPSNKAKVEAAFGPSEFNRLEDAEDAVIERLPDLAPNKDDQAYAEELANKTDGVADMLRGWARGENVGKEVEEWLSQR